MRPLCRSAFALFTALTVAGCVHVNPYSQWYQTFPERARADSSVAERDIWIVIGQNPRDEVPVMLRNGYSVIGISQFNGPVTMTTDKMLRAQAAKVGAELVLQWAYLTDTGGVHLDPFTVAPRPKAATDSMVRAAYGAMYFVHHADPVGLYVEDADDQDTERLHVHYALQVDLVVHDSPAEFADFQPGDVIVQIGGAPIPTDFNYRKFIESRRGKWVHFLVDRDGAQLIKSVNVRP